jgi:hypothetical protein
MREAFGVRGIPALSRADRTGHGHWLSHAHSGGMRRTPNASRTKSALMGARGEVQEPCPARTILTVREWLFILVLVMGTNHRAGKMRSDAWGQAVTNRSAERSFHMALRLRRQVRRRDCRIERDKASSPALSWCP